MVKSAADQSVDPASESAEPKVLLSADGASVRFAGSFTTSTIVQAASLLAQTLGVVEWHGPQVTLDFSDVKVLDTAGATLLRRYILSIEAAHIAIDYQGIAASQLRLLDVITHMPPPATAPRSRRAYVFNMLAMVGRGAVEVLEDARAILTILGEFIAAIGRVLTLRSSIRWVALVSHLERAGVQAVPIIALMNFLIGMILAQQGGFYFRSFGAELFMVNLVGVLVSREIGVLITAIMVAGRSGSAFTAEIGAMRMREEVDAMMIMGISPVDALVVPRVLALMISLPLLTIVADFSAIAGAWVISLEYLGFPTETFIQRLHDAITLTHLTVGIVKAPFMAIVVGLVACVEGLRVAGSADSLGAQTTASVVKGIFLVVVMDGVFAIFFAAMGI